MDYGWIIPVLAVLTLCIVVFFAVTSKAKTESDLGDPRDPKSALAKDGPQGGVAFLTPDATPANPPPDPIVRY